jgi:hypothetical protein
MRSLGLSGKSAWGPSPGPDDAESWLGALVQEPLVGAIALLLFAVALALVTLAPAQTISARAPASPAAASTPRAFGGQLPAPPSPPPTVSQQSERHIRGAYAKLPLSFIENKGQTNKRVRYYAQGQGYNFFFTNNMVALVLTKGRHEQVLDLRFLGARSNASLERGPPLPRTVNYISGRDHSKWHTNLRISRSLRYRDLWPGIDMVFTGKGGKLRYEFLVRPGANPSEIRLAYQGAKGLSLSKVGDLLIRTPLGAIRDQRPKTYQRIAGRTSAVGSPFALQSGSPVPPSASRSRATITATRW